MSGKVIPTDRRRWRRDLTHGWFVVNGRCRGPLRDDEMRSGRSSGNGTGIVLMPMIGTTSGGSLGVDRRLLVQRRLRGGGGQTLRCSWALLHVSLVFWLPSLLPVSGKPTSVHVRGRAGRGHGSFWI